MRRTSYRGNENGSETAVSQAESQTGTRTSRSDVSDDARGDLSEGFVRADPAFVDELERLPAVVPLTHALGCEGVAQIPRLMTSNRLFESDVELVQACDTLVFSPESFQPIGIVAKVEDAIQDDVIPEIQRLTSGGLHEYRRIGGSRLSRSTSQELATEVVLMNHRCLGSE